MSSWVIEQPERLTIDGEVTGLDVDLISGRLNVVGTDGPARIEITGDLDNPYDSEIRLETTSGEITARVREDSDLDVHLHATSGRVTTAFAELHTTSHHGAPRTVRGRLGAATGKLYASAVSGNISLLRRPVDYDEPEEPA